MTDEPLGVEWLSEPTNFYACLVLSHRYEQQLQAKSDNSVYTPQEITDFMAEKSTSSYILDQLNDKHDTNYESIEEVFGRV